MLIIKIRLVKYQMHCTNNMTHVYKCQSGCFSQRAEGHFGRRIMLRTTSIESMWHTT